MEKLKKKISEKLQQMNEAKLMVKPEQFDDVADKLGPDDVVKFVDESGIQEAKDENNPWAICTASVGRDNQEKYESCVKQVKKQYNIGENVTEEMYLAEFDGEDYERGSREVESGINPELEDDWNSLLNQVDEDDTLTADVNTDKLKADVQRFMDKLNLAQFEKVLAKIDKPVEQAEMIAAFSERIGVPRTKLPMVLQQLRDVSESVKPRMTKDALVEYVKKNKK